MAFSHGSRAKLYLDDAAGTERDLSSYISETGLERSSDNAEVSALGDTAKKFISGLIEGSFSLEGHYDPTAEGYLNGLYALAPGSTGSQFKFFPAGSASGRTYYDGTALCNGVTISTPVDDKASLSSEFQVNGTPTFGTA